MKNRILNFVRDFNEKLEKSNTDYTPYNYLQYKSDGTVESISLPDINLFDDQNDSTEFVIQNCSATIVLALESIVKNARKILYKEVNKFVDEMTKDNSIPRYELYPKGSYTWELTVGEEYEDLISDNDFTYLFPGCKLWIRGDEKFTLALPESLEIGMYCITKDGKTVKITSDDMLGYTYDSFDRMATNAEIEKYKKDKL